MNAPTATRDRTVEEHWTTVDGTLTRYLEAGHGHPVLLIPGEGSVSEEWWDILTGLAGTHRAIAIDLPGYGYTEPIPHASPESLATFVWRFARTLGLERPALVGHSLGGAVAVHAALQRPRHVPALALVSSAGMGRAINPLMIVQSVTPLGDLTVWLIPRLILGPTVLVLSEAIAGSLHPWRIDAHWWFSQILAVSTPGTLNTTLRSQRQAVGVLGQKHPLLHRLPELPMPTLVAWGVHDLLVPFWQAVAARRRLRRGRLRLLPLTGHLLPLEAPDALLAALRPLLADLDHAVVEEGSPA